MGVAAAVFALVTADEGRAKAAIVVVLVILAGHLLRALADTISKS